MNPRAGPPPSDAALAPGWRALPWVAATAIWLGLAIVAFSPAIAARIRAMLPWMLDPTFHDLWVVRLGWASAQAGGDPLAALDNPFNYPRVVLLGARLGGLRLPVAIEGLATAGIALAALAWVLRPRRRREAIAATAILASPPVLLLIERGNLDAWALALVALGLAIGDVRHWRAGPILAPAALLAAALLKLYPAVALVPAVAQWRRVRRWWAAGALLLFAGWLGMHLGEIALIFRKTTTGVEPAYGREIAGSRFYFERWMPGEPLAVAVERLRAVMRLSLAASGLGLAAAAYFGWRRRAAVAAIAGGPDASWCAAGAAIYAATFLLGSNWSYRLVFLALAVPWLWRLSQTRSGRGVGGALLTAILLTLFTPFHLPLGAFVFIQATEWVLAFALAGLAVALTTTDPAASAGPGDRWN